MVYAKPGTSGIFQPHSAYTAGQAGTFKNFKNSRSSGRVPRLDHGVLQAVRAAQCLREARRQEMARACQGIPLHCFTVFLTFGYFGIRWHIRWHILAGTDTFSTKEPVATDQSPNQCTQGLSRKLLGALRCGFQHSWWVTDGLEGLVWLMFTV